ncbi:hypothetical protein PAXRUDRAFT_308036 [Paxillus rubicundulus Ve08.2h10]|uniref:Uncharacterized protein n=1 Tax=Paxillus rubicundulus Ve08.2h10 TaxID=930991 RepID=A0A0D0DFI5_9AGAM|nr:hypothetical protein PAXRUDRAFT_308036 [Paxillus rubicundulus Ve08.2h10]
MSNTSDFLSGRDLTRGDYNESVNYDTPGNVRSQAAGDDSSLSGAHGGSGYGQAGGYSSSHGHQQGKQSVADDYAGYDPGMAGCGSDDTQDCSVPGAGHLGGERYVPTYPGQSGSLGPGATSYSRGYERDNDEYDPSSTTDNPTTGTQGGKPSLGEKVKGGMEKMAGKVVRDPHLEVKGEQRQTGQF